MTLAVPSKRFQRLRRVTGAALTGWRRVGTQAEFYGKTLMSIPDALVNYRTEVWRLIAQMGLGAGALAVVQRRHGAHRAEPAGEVVGNGEACAQRRPAALAGD